MIYKRSIATISIVAGLLFCITPPSIAADVSHERGVEATTNSRYADAITHFTAAAERVDRDAQRDLGLMLFNGERIYGRVVPRNLAQVKRWFQAVGAQGCDGSSTMLRLLTPLAA